MQSEWFQKLEVIAANNKPLPKDIDPPEVMLYYMLHGMYASYHSGKISKEQGQSMKREIYNTYQKVSDDYRQYIEICREYQKRLREGYSVGGKEII